jgi:hypothetical protein
LEHCRIKGIWRDCELYKLFNDQGITKYIKINRLSLAGQITCMGNSRTVKNVFDVKSDGTKKTGKTKLRWEDGVI